MKKLLLFIVICSAVTQVLVGSYGCATIVPPPGGLRDSLPPVLLSVNPPDSTLQFNRRRIEFSFDEYVQIADANQEVIINPLTKVKPTVDYKLKTVTVKFSNQDTLEENTTYTIDFGKAIRDLNESNQLQNFTYTFSTGNSFDSLSLAGKIILAETGGIDSTLTVILHSSEVDSAVVKDRPKYVTKVNRKGEFVFKNLPAKVFHIYALKDEGAYRYMKEDQLFAFHNKPVVAGSADSIVLYAYKSAEKKQSAVSAPTGRRRSNEAARIKYTTNLTNGKQDLLSPLEISFDYPLTTFDSSQISFYKDSAFLPITNYQLNLDSNRTKITLAHEWTEDSFYQLVLNKEFAIDTFNQKLLLNDTLRFATKKNADYGSLLLTLTNVPAVNNPVLLFVQADKVVKSFPIVGNTLSIPVILPGDYQLRLLADENNNGIWDPGDFFNGKKQPERIIPIERKITVRSNWQNDIEIRL